VQAAKRTPVDLQEWAVGLMERNNRKSHLAPMLSPASQDLLRGDYSPTGDYQDMSRTPTSGDIPIGSTEIRATVISPREQIINTINSARTPKVNGSVGRTATLPMRPAPPGGPLPPPPVPRKENSDGRRQAPFGNGY
jgi:mitogen-activated protein kinase kinase